ncbi:MAG TPA: hypothetical protein VFU46_09710 [Gemmatimonadales bacterium]|nr:hypothetical protein [Gemmatimonadales bacterium]
MAEPTTAASAPPPPPPPRGGKQALFEAAQEVVRKQAEERQAELAAAAKRRARSRVSPVVAVGCAFILAMAAYVAVEQPGWMFPRPAAQETAEVQEASLRISMASAAQRIERFRLARGRLPGTLVETGSTPHGISYRRIDSTRYLLHGSNGPATLTFKSGDSLGVFVGRSFDVIAARVPR